MRIRSYRRHGRTGGAGWKDLSPAARLFLWGLFGLFPLTFGGLGIQLALKAEDFGTPLRILLGILGTLGVLGALGPAAWMAIRARPPREAGQDARRAPKGYLLMDLASVVLTPVLASWFTMGADLDVPAVVAPLTTYKAAFLSGMIGLAIRLRDPAYLAGLARWTGRWTGYGPIFVSLGVVLGLVGGGGWADAVHPLVALPAGIAMSTWLHVQLLRRSAFPPTRPAPVLLCRVSSFLMVPLVLAHEGLAFRFLEGLSTDLGALALPMVWSVVMFLVLPPRMHWFVEAPEDPMNRLSFAVTVTWLAVYAVFGLA
ncbi:MAG: hypothetical protein FJ098_16915 [Deltaproteobacteria bacterium]|nr:hypothetical protein [Deltaproteobacteria bacterium]